jgi:hypothetical protein
MLITNMPSATSNSKTRILFLSDNFPPEVNAPASRTYDHCKVWAQDPSVEITVITSFPNFPQGKIYEGYKQQFVQKEVIENVTVYRVWTLVAENKGFILRTCDYLSFAALSFLVNSNPDMCLDYKEHADNPLYDGLHGSQYLRGPMLKA